MSWLEDLIQTLCPDGVEYRSVGELCVVYTGGEVPENFIKSKTPVDDYIYPIYSNGINENALYGYSKKYKIEDDAVTFSSIGTIGFPTIRQGKFTPIIRLKVIVPKKGSSLTLGYLKYALEIVDFRKNKSSVPNINSKMIKNILIPLPPLSVQEEIVRILDTFTALETELEKQLEAELAARTKQYEHYRNELLSFDSNSKIIENLLADFCPDGVEYKKLGDYAPPTRGVRVVKSQLSLEGRFPVYQNSMTPLGYFEDTNCPAETAFIISAGAAGEVGYSDVDFWAADDCFYFPCPEQLLSRFLYHFLKSQQDFLLSRVRKASVPRLARSVVEGIQIPIPPLPVQEKIVSILDRFDALINDLKSGLPAEIALRRKQYEYYRNKLLTFKPIQPPL